MTRFLVYSASQFLYSSPLRFLSSPQKSKDRGPICVLQEVSNRAKHPTAWPKEDQDGK